MAGPNLLRSKAKPETNASKVAIRIKDSTKQAAEKLAAQRQALAKNTVLDKYKIGVLIGIGRFSLVYQGFDTETGDSVVVKEYYPKYYSKRAEDGITLLAFEGRKLITFNEGFKQFFNEALALHKIDHPNVLKAHNFFRANKTAYMVSNHEAGRDLKWFLDTTQEPLNNKLIYKIFMPILSALNRLHDSGCLHLDIKPANILLRANSKPLLLDFGAAQDMASKKRINNMQALTHGFAPPEQYDRKSNLSRWTDIYAVAATLYYAITNRPPAKSKDSNKQSQLSIQKHQGHYTSEMLKAINQSLVHDYGKRFEFVDAFAKELLTASKWDSLETYEREEMSYYRHGDNDKTPPLGNSAAF